MSGGMPVVLLGDLNATPESTELRPLTGRMVDAWITAASGGAQVPPHLAAGHTFSRRNSLCDPEDWQVDSRIDYVLASSGPSHRQVQVQVQVQVEVESTYVFDKTVDGVQPSDHYAVVADLII